MLGEPWPPPGLPQPRDAHGAQWANDVDRVRRARDLPRGSAADLWADLTGREPAGQRRSGDSAADVRPGPTRDPAATPRFTARWVPQEEWIPDPAPSPESLWTPERDWAAAFTAPGAAAAPVADVRARRPWRVVLTVACVLALPAAVAVLVGLLG